MAVTTAGVLATAALVGGGISAYGSYQQGQEAKKAQEYNASVNQQEAAMLQASGQREAQIIGENQKLNEYRQRKELDISKGSMVAGFAKRGVNFTGSPLDAIADSISNAELDIAVGKWNANNNINTTLYNTSMGVANKQSEANMRRMYGLNASNNATMQGVGTLLSTGYSAYDKYSDNIPKSTLKRRIGE